MEENNIKKIKKQKIIKHIEDCLEPSHKKIPNNYEKLPKCLIKFIDIGTHIKIEKDGNVYSCGKLYCYYKDNILIKHYNIYIFVDIDEYNIYILNPETTLRFKKLLLEKAKQNE